MTSRYFCRVNRVIVFVVSVLLYNFLFVSEGLAVVDGGEYLICSPRDPNVGQLYYPGDTNNTLAADAAAYLSDRFHPERIKPINDYVDLADAVYLLNYLFLGGPAPVVQKSGDVNQDGQINIADPVAILNYLFLGAEVPGKGELKVTFSDNNGRGIDTVNHLTAGGDLRVTIEQKGIVYNSENIAFRRIVVSFVNLDAPENFEHYPLITILGPYSNPWSYLLHPKDVSCANGTHAKVIELYLPDHLHTAAYIEINGVYTTAPFVTLYRGYKILDHDFRVYSSPLMGGGASDDGCGNGNNGAQVVAVEKWECPPVPENNIDWSQVTKGLLGHDYMIEPPPAPPVCPLTLPDWMQGPINALTAANGFFEDELGVTFEAGPEGASMGLNALGAGRAVAAAAQGCTTVYTYCEAACGWMGDKLQEAAQSAAQSIGDTIDSIGDGLDTIKGWLGG